MKEKKLKKKSNRKNWFKCLKQVLKIFIRKPKYIYLGEEFCDGALILSNHCGAKGPLKLECYFPKLFRFWGTYEMNSSLKEVYKYLSEIYFTQKKHWNAFLARAFSIIAAPFAYIFYRGLNLISTYRDYRLKNTVLKSFETIKKGESIVIFPEDSSRGYFSELSGFFQGFVFFADYCLKKGIDLPVYVTYLQTKNNLFIVDKPFKWSEMSSKGFSREQIADMLLERCNLLGKENYAK